MKNLLNIRLLLLLLSVLFMGMSCEKDEKGRRINYYKTKGEGYVFMYDSLGNFLYPIQDVNIQVVTRRKGIRGNFIDPDPREFFVSDAIGKYQVRFIKRTRYWDAQEYDFILDYVPESFSSHNMRDSFWRLFAISVDEVKNAQKTIILDTLKLYK